MISHDKHIFNTFGLEAVAAAYIEYSSAEELRHELPQAREPFLHVGGGSNLLFASLRFEGTVFHNSARGVEVLPGEGDELLVRAGGGLLWDEFVQWCVLNGYYGAENLSLIPGEVGAAAVQNIGAYGAEVKDIIERVEAFDIVDGVEVSLGRDECHYGYRSSLFKTPGGRRYFVLSVVFRLGLKPCYNLGYGPLKEIPEAELSLESVRAKVVATRCSKLPDPAVIGSAGSFFMNPVVPASKAAALKAEYPDMPQYPAQDGFVKLSAGWMIDRCGLKGYRHGNAGVYEKQALVLVNLGGATSEEILALSNEVITAVEKKFGVTLRPEVQIIRNEKHLPL